MVDVAAGTADPAGAAAVAAAKHRAFAAIAPVDAEVQQLSARIHANPELGYAEHQASAWVSELLARHGFSVEKPLAGLETALPRPGGAQGRRPDRRPARRI